MGERGFGETGGQGDFEFSLERARFGSLLIDERSWMAAVVTLRGVDKHLYTFLKNNDVNSVDGLGLIKAGDPCDPCCTSCDADIQVSTDSIKAKKVKANPVYVFTSTCLVADDSESGCECCHYDKITWMACLKCDGIPAFSETEEISFDHECEPTSARGGRRLTIRAYLYYYECSAGRWLGPYSESSNILVFDWDGSQWTAAGSVDPGSLYK